MLATEKNQLLPRFNTQPRGGGCVTLDQPVEIKGEFQHTAARRRLQSLF